MSQTRSTSSNRAYGLARVCRVWKVAHSSVCGRRYQESRVVPATRRRGPDGPCSHPVLLRHIRRVLRLMRENGLLAPVRMGHALGPRAHDSSIIPDRPDKIWGTDATSTLTAEGSATVVILIDHCTGECLGIHAARRGTRYEALEPLKQAVPRSFGRYAENAAGERGLLLRHDHGSQFVSHAFQGELAFLGIKSSRSYVREPEGNGCSERFIRMLKEQLLRLRRFATIDELFEALHDFRKLFNEN